MPRHLRFIVPDVPIHIIQRGNNRLECFFSDVDYLVYLDMLRDSSQRAGCRLHAYVLMTNHVHLLITPEHREAPAKMMKSLGERYVQYVNRRYSRSGTLWEGRYRSCLIECARYLMVCHRYIELNPVRAQMVAHPALYPWSSYRFNAHGESDALIRPHDLYTQLGSTAAAREIAYRSLFNAHVPTRTINSLRRATNANLTFGNKAFADEMAKALGRAVTPNKAGRPSVR